jgi:hypothetical protein
MTCTQFSYFQTCEAAADCPFSSLMDLASQVKICQDAFAGFMDEAYVGDRVDFTNDYLGGQGITASNILFTNGGVSGEQEGWRCAACLAA